MKQAVSTLTLLTGLLFLNGCGGSESDPATVDTNTTASVLHECNVYTPTELKDIQSGTMTETGSTKPHTFYITTPSDPGGGYLSIAIKLSGFQREDRRDPFIAVAVDGASGAAILHNGNVDEDSHSIAFSAAPSTTYKVDIGNGFAQENIAYTYTWSFESKMDCYEPNDGRSLDPDGKSNAKQIPNNQILGAYAIYNHFDNGTIDHGIHMFDWYKFTIDEASTVSFEFTESPSDAQMEVLVFSADREVPLNSVGQAPNVGDVFSSGTMNLSAGTYYVKIRDGYLGRGNKAVLSYGETIPDVFNTPYKFRVNVTKN